MLLGGELLLLGQLAGGGGFGDLLESRADDRGVRSGLVLGLIPDGLGTPDHPGDHTQRRGEDRTDHPHGRTLSRLRPPASSADRHPVESSIRAIIGLRPGPAV